MITEQWNIMWVVTLLPMHSLCVCQVPPIKIICAGGSTGGLTQVIVENLPRGNYFQSNLPSTNDLTCTLAGQCEMAMPTLLSVNTWPLDSDCCVGETGPWRQNLRTGSACKTDTCLNTTSVGDRTQYTTVNIKKKAGKLVKKVILFWLSLLHC